MQATRRYAPSIGLSPDDAPEAGGRQNARLFAPGHQGGVYGRQEAPVCSPASERAALLMVFSVYCGHLGCLHLLS